MGDVRALNVWLSLSHCGDEAPGMDIVPRRLDHIVPTGTEGANFNWSVSRAGGRGGGRERRGSCGRSSSPGTCCSSTTCSCIPRRRSRRCRRAAGRSRAGSSAPQLRRRNIRRLRPSRAAEPERFFFVHMQKTGGTSLYMRTKRHFGEAGVYPDDSDGDVQDVAPQLMVHGAAGALAEAPGPDPPGRPDTSRSARANCSTPSSRRSPCCATRSNGR